MLPFIANRVYPVSSAAQLAAIDPTGTLRQELLTGPRVDLASQTLVGAAGFSAIRAEVRVYSNQANVNGDAVVSGMGDMGALASEMRSISNLIPLANALDGLPADEQFALSGAVTSQLLFPPSSPPDLPLDSVVDSNFTQAQEAELVVGIGVGAGVGGFVLIAAIIAIYLYLRAKKKGKHTQMGAPLTQSTDYPSVEEAVDTSSPGATSYETEDVLTLGSVSAALSAQTLRDETRGPDQTPPKGSGTYDAQYNFLSKQESMGEAL